MPITTMACRWSNGGVAYKEEDQEVCRAFLEDEIPASLTFLLPELVVISRHCMVKAFRIVHSLMLLSTRYDVILVYKINQILD